jgi:hypothetical protein
MRLLRKEFMSEMEEECGIVPSSDLTDLAELACQSVRSNSNGGRSIPRPVVAMNLFITYLEKKVTVLEAGGDAELIYKVCVSTGSTIIKWCLWRDVCLEDLRGTPKPCSTLSFGSCTWEEALPPPAGNSAAPL